MKSIEISVDECHAGSVLTEDVNNASGAVMLKAGTVLTEDKINTLIRIGVTEVSIVNNQKLSPEQLEKKRKAVNKLMKGVFRKVESDLGMKKLKDILTEYYINER
ncbi:MAG: hypothetical protein OEY52_11175 [Gammaproteobacteria bacterium]|nr:hypothetical protein [Gammaproteobacteria bacterium]